MSGRGVVMSNASAARDYLTAEEAAAEFRVSESAVCRKRREHRLPGRQGCRAHLKRIAPAVEARRRAVPIVPWPDRTGAA